MKIDQFFNEYNGKYKDWDGAYGNQCVDLMRFYQRDVLNVPSQSIPPNVGARQIFQAFLSGGNKHFAKISNSPTNAPKKGDIVFWGIYLWVTGWYGHVAICESADIKNILTFGQNYPTGTPCHFQKLSGLYPPYGYRGVLGWLRKR